MTEEKAPAKTEKVDCHKLEPLLIGILVDMSGSRRSDSHLLAHSNDLEAFLKTLLTGEDGAYLVAYGDEVRKLSEVVTDPQGISAAFDKLREQQPIGSTAVYDAITAAANANFKGRAGRRILIVIGDWEDNSSHVRSDEALKVAQRTSTTIYAILDADNGVEGKRSHRRAVEIARQLAEQTGGFAYEVRDKNDFSKILQGIGGAVVSACKVTYTTPGTPDTKKGVRLHVQADSKDVSIRALQLISMRLS